METGTAHGFEEGNIDDKKDDVLVEEVPVDEESQASENEIAAERMAFDPEIFSKIQLINKGIQDMGFGWYQWKVFWSAGLGWFADNIWLQVISILMTFLQYEFESKGQIPKPTSVHIREITLCMYAGLMTGAVFFGVLADIVGRYKVWNTTLFVSGIFGIAAGGVTTFTQLGSMIALTAFGAGGNLPVDGVMCLEFLPGTQQHILTALSLFWAFGQLVASLIAWGFVARASSTCFYGKSTDEAFICDKSNNVGWRYTYYTLGAMIIFLAIARIFIFRVDESPKFLVICGRYDKAYKVMENVARSNGKAVPFTLEELEACGRTPHSEKPQHAHMSARERVVTDIKSIWFIQMKSLFVNKKIAINTGIIVLVYAAIGLAYPLWTSFLGSFLANKEASTGNSTIDATFGAYSYQAAAGIPGSILAGYLVNFKFIGRKIGLCIFTAMSGAFLFGITGSTTAPAINGLTSMVSFSTSGMYGVLYGYAPEVFPTHARGTGDSLCAAANRLLGGLAPIIAVWSPALRNVNGPVYAAAAVFMFSAATVMFLPIETVGTTAL